MKNVLTKILVFAVVLLILGTFGIRTTTKVPDIDVSKTAMINTMVAGYFQTETASVPLATPTLALILTPTPTITTISPTYVVPPPPIINTIPPTIVFASPNILPTAVSNSAILSSGCYNLAFFRDANIPPGTIVKPREEFTKEWSVENTGTCPWTYQFILTNIGGDDLESKSAIIRKVVEVGAVSRITVDFKAPKKPGAYTSYWRMSDGASLFGDTLVVSIIVSQ